MGVWIAGQGRGMGPTGRRPAHYVAGRAARRYGALPSHGSRAAVALHTGTDADVDDHLSPCAGLFEPVLSRMAAPCDLTIQPTAG